MTRRLRRAAASVAADCQPLYRPPKVIAYYPPSEDLVLYACPILRPRVKNRSGPGLEIVATGTLISVADRQFVVTANHVLGGVGQSPILYPEDAESAVPFHGPFFTVRAEGGDVGPPFSNLDVAVSELEVGKLHEGYRFLGVGQIGYDEPVPQGVTCIAAGYRIGVNKTIRNSLNVTAQQEKLEFLTLDPAAYSRVGLDPKYHLAVVHDRMVTSTTGQRMKPPSLKGLSGGPMWIKTGSGYALVATTSDHLESERIVFGTRVSVSMKIIRGLLRE